MKYALLFLLIISTFLATWSIVTADVFGFVIGTIALCWAVWRLKIAGDQEFKKLQDDLEA